jgi:uncharacterized membrane protein
MKKRKFLSDLEEKLEDKEFEFKEIERIVNDYESLIDDAIADGKDEIEFINSLGSVREIVSNLIKSLPKVKRKDHLAVALSPFIATISFFILGFFFNAWHPGWLVFLGIPITAILVESRHKTRFIGLFPIVYTIFYILVGTYGNREFIFVASIISSEQIQVSLPLLWHPLWAGYLYTIALSELIEKDDGFRSKVVAILTFLLVSAYLAFELIFGFRLWHLVFIAAIIVIGIINGSIRFIIDIKLEGFKNKRIQLLILGFALIITLVYLTLGFLYQTWGIMWVLFLLIPMLAIFLEQRFTNTKTELVAYTPFIAIILFFLVGYYFDLFFISWLFFLLIPITAIIEEQFKN